jgi:sulfhydrogenase subunit delta
VARAPKKKQEKETGTRRRPPPPPAAAKKTLAVWKFASCDGCQLTLLDCEDELLAVADAVTIAEFAEATTSRIDGPYDVSLVEGSITTAHDAERIRQVRAASRLLVTIGACATAGGIQALRNGQDVGAWTRSIYAAPEYISTLATSTPIADHVKVDLELRGCPIDKRQLLAVLTALIQDRAPRLRTEPVCVECKLRGAVCVLVAKGEPCLGPVTRTGCGALCPTHDRPCYGCFGPAESNVTAPLAARLVDVQRRTPLEVARLFASFNAGAPAFAREAAAQQGRPLPVVRGAP